ncbi:MAG: Rieske 2Fe-2S domain-containing protein [Actinomycetota bacterium]|nr:Rieske 2Fe-2S domain-containing protein [Actinomycetota bacterium]
MWTEAALQRVERLEVLNELGKKATLAFSNVVRPGRVKDLLSGTWMGHPAHPMLTDLPIGAWVSAVVLDVVGNQRSAPTADALVGLGVLAALPTAVTGLNDLADIVDPEERAIGTAHAIGNWTAVVLYGASYLTRRRGRRDTGTALALAGTAALTVSGFLGGHLAYRRGVGVAQTAFQPRLEDWTPVLDNEDLPGSKPVRVSVGGVDVLLYRNDATIYAMANRCTHRGGPLHKGKVKDAQVTCPWHLSTFAMEDGSVVHGPATAPQPSYEVRTRDGKIEIRSRP